MRRTGELQLGSDDAVAEQPPVSGQYFDAETGLSHHWSRDDDPILVGADADNSPEDSSLSNASAAPFGRGIPLQIMLICLSFRENTIMKRPEDLVVGKMYFDVLYEDRNMQYPMIRSYEYCGMSSCSVEGYEFRIIGANDLVVKDRQDLESLQDTIELMASLREWARRNPALAQ